MVDARIATGKRAQASPRGQWQHLIRNREAGPPGRDGFPVEIAHDHDEPRDALALRPSAQSDRGMEDVLDRVDDDGSLFPG